MTGLRSLLGGLGLACVLALSACGQHATRAPCAQGKLCFETGNTSDPISLDPHKITTVPEGRLIGDMLIGLTQDGVSGEVVPGVATSWETSADGLVWTFHLRDSTWSDGVPFTADDFVFSLRRLLDPKTAAEYASLTYIIKNAEAVNSGKAPPTALGVRAVDPHTLEITLDHPAPYLLELAKHQTMSPVPKHVVEKWGDAWSDPEHFVSNGPYKLRSWRLQKDIIADKNPRFWDAAKVCFDQVTYYPTDDPISAERQVQRGELDVNPAVTANRVGYLRQPGKMPEFVHSHTYLAVFYLQFNFGKEKFKDPRVRRALAMAVDRDFIADGISKNSGITAAYTFVPPGVANYSPPPRPAWTGMTLAQRQAEARRLLAAAGYGPNHPLEVNVMTPNLDATAMLSSIQSDWRAIGVKTTVTGAEFQIQLQAMRMRDFEIGLSGWVADYNDAMSFLYLMKSATGTMNYGDYKSGVFDDFVQQADNEPDVKKRADLMGKAETQVLTDDPLIPLYFTASTSLVNPRISGWIDNIADHHQSRYLCFKDANGKPMRGG